MKIPIFCILLLAFVGFSHGNVVGPRRKLLKSIYFLSYPHTCFFFSLQIGDHFLIRDFWFSQKFVEDEFLLKIRSWLKSLPLTKTVTGIFKRKRIAFSSSIWSTGTLKMLKISWLYVMIFKNIETTTFDPNFNRDLPMILSEFRFTMEPMKIFLFSL